MKKHIVELKNRILLLSFCWSTTFMAVYAYKEILLITVLRTTTKFFNKKFDSFIITNFTELFTVYIKLGCFISNQVLCGYFLINFLYFSAPGLYLQEYRLLNLTVKTIIFFWILSFWILHNFLGPVVWQFFFNFQKTLDNQGFYIHFEAKIIEFLIFFINICHSCNIQSQCLAFLFLFFNYFNINKNLIKNARKIFYLIFLLGSTLLTPPDLISQISIFIILIFFFELLVLLSLLLKKYEILIG